MPRKIKLAGNEIQEIIPITAPIASGTLKKNKTKRLNEELPGDSQLKGVATCNSNIISLSKSQGLEEMDVTLQNSGDMIYCTSAMLSMYAMQQKGLLCDFLITVLPSSYNNLEESVTYKVHHLIFMTISKRIQDLKNPLIKLGGKVTCEGLERVIEYVYTGQIANIKEFSLESLTHINRAALALSIQLDNYIKKHRPDFVSTSTKIYVGHLRADEKNSNKPVVTVSKSSPCGKLMPLGSFDNGIDLSPVRKKSTAEELLKKCGKKAKETRAKEISEHKALRREKNGIRRKELRKRKEEDSSQLTKLPHICKMSKLTAKNSLLEDTVASNRVVDKPETFTTFVRDELVTNEIAQNVNADDFETHETHQMTTNTMSSSSSFEPTLSVSLTYGNPEANSLHSPRDCDVTMDPFQHFS